DDLDAVGRDEAAIGGAAARRELGRRAGLLCDGRGDGLDELPLRRQERAACNAPRDLVIDTERVELALDARRQRLRRPLRGVAKVETALELAGRDVRRAGIGVDVDHLERRRREVTVAAVDRLAR